MKSIVVFVIALALILFDAWMVMLLIGIVHAHVLPAVEAAGLGDCIPIAILLSFLFGGSVSSKN